MTGGAKFKNGRAFPHCFSVKKGPVHLPFLSPFPTGSIYWFIFPILFRSKDASHTITSKIMATNNFILLLVSMSVALSSPMSILPIEEEPLGVNEDFCSSGPPGRYCLKDLSGYYDCRIDPKTGTYFDKVHSCPEGRRYDKYCSFYSLSN